MYATGGGNSNYRSDIDGLRALACLAVVIYHAFPEYLKGGFVGVDIFFVISGFLISSILYRHLFSETAPGKVQIIDFYIRRVRRIFPALIAVLISCLALGWFVLLPEEYKLLGKHTAGGATYVSNIILYLESGDYFNASSNAKPLLHLWSLGVEEQFYLIFPIFLWLVYKSRINFVLALLVFTLISFFLNKNGIAHHSQSKVFYMPYTRFWELSIGAILAYLVNYNQRALSALKEKTNELLVKCLTRSTGSNTASRFININNLLSLAGFALIVYGYATIDNGANFPGKKALIPVFGALMVIAAGREAILNRYILSSKIFIFFGLISYPLYLWHWPLLSISYICAGGVPVAEVRAVAVILAIVLATATFYFIEPPLRYGRFPKVKAVGLFLTLLLVGFLGYRVYATNGFVHRFSKLEEAQADYFSRLSEVKSISEKYVQNCMQKYPEWIKQNYKCSLNLNDDYKIAVIGDSHAGQLREGLQDWIQINKPTIGLDVFPISCQLPFLDFVVVTNDRNLSRMRYDGSFLVTRAIKDTVKDPNIKLIILAHRPLNSWIEMKDRLNPNEKDRNLNYANGIKRTLDYISAYSDKKVLFILDNPQLPFAPSSCISRPLDLDFSGQRKCRFDKVLSEQKGHFAEYNRAVKHAVKMYKNVDYIDLHNALCNDDVCYLSDRGVALYRDDNHFNVYGSKFVAPYIMKKVMEMLE